MCDGGTTITKYYFLGGMLIAKAEGGVLTYLHSDHLGSVVLETNTAGNVVNDQRYYAYGRRLDGGGDISGEKDFTGQEHFYHWMKMQTPSFSKKLGVCIRSGFYLLIAGR